MIGNISKEENVLFENLEKSEWQEFIAYAISGGLFGGEEPRWSETVRIGDNAVIMYYVHYAILCGFPKEDCPYEGYFILGSCDWESVSKDFYRYYTAGN